MKSVNMVNFLWTIGINIISKKYYNLTIKLVLEVEPSWWDFLKKKCLFEALMAD